MHEKEKRVKITSTHEKNREKSFNNNKSNNNKQEKEILNLKEAKIEIEEFSEKLLKIKKNYYYYLLDRNKYDINRIMSLLDIRKINQVKEIFSEHANGIEKNIFIKKLKKIIQVDNFDLPNLVYGLYKFFCEIDYNGDNHMKWEEFTQFIIDTVEGDSEAKNVEDQEHKKIFDEKQMMKYKRYQLSTKIKDTHLYKKEIINAFQFPMSNYIAFNEYGTRFLKLCNPHTGKNEKNIDIEEYINPPSEQNPKDNKIKKKSKSDISFKTSNKSLAYRILSVVQYQSLLVLLLSDKRIIFLNFEPDDHVELLYQLDLPVLEKRIWYLKYHNMWLSAGMKLPKFNFYTLNELDIELQCKRQKYEILHNNNRPYRMHFTTKSSVHTEEILDCIEITKPLLLLTACMDSKIRLINIETENVVKIWTYHKLGVKQLDYNPNLDGGYILSVGFEYFINIYNLEFSLEDSYKGKLEGSFSPVVSCQFIQKSYMAIAVDEEGNVRVWNIKGRVCTQFIPQLKKKCKINNLLMLPKSNKFIIYGNRILYYESQYKINNNNENNNREDNSPFKVVFNYYYNQFFIGTPKDIRVYTSRGELIKIYKKLIQDYFDIDVKIKNFIFENNYRKIYVGFSNGAILLFNAGNGSLIKPVNEISTIKDKIITTDYAHSKDISGLYFYPRPNDENLLISTSYDSLINISYEKNPERSELLKTIKGGHSNNKKNYEILCMDLSETLNLLATGGSDGFVVIWDFEMSRIIHIFNIDINFSFKYFVTCVKFLEPFPILAAAFSDGSLYLFKVNKDIEKDICIMRARNYCKVSGMINVGNIEVMNIFYGSLLSENNNNEVCLKKYFDENSPFMNKIKLKLKKKNSSALISSSIKENKDSNNKDNQDNQENKEKELKENLDIVPDIYKDEIFDMDLDQYISGESSLENNPEQLKYYLILGDENGYVKVINLYPIFQKYDITPVKNQEIKSYLNLYKKDEINVSSIVKFILKKIQEFNNINNYPNFLNLYYNLIIFEQRLHQEKIMHIEIISEPLSFITCSKDNYLKIFNFQFECLGIINTLPKLSTEEINWNFKIDEKQILQKEINEIVDIFEKIGVEPIIIGSELDKEVKNKIKEENEEKIIEKKINVKKEIIKKRFKPYIKAKEENKKKIKKLDEYEDDSEKENGYMAAERYYVRNSQNQIEKAMSGGGKNNGIGEIASQLIDMTLIKEKEKNNINKEKEFSEKDKEKDELNNTHFSLNKDYKNISLSRSNTKKITKRKKYSLNDIAKIKDINNLNNNILEEKTIKSRFNINKEITNKNKSINNNNLSDKILLYNDSSIQDMHNALTPRNIPINKTMFPSFTSQIRSIYSSKTKNQNVLSERNKIEEYNKIKKIKKREIKQENRNIKKIPILKIKKNKKIDYNFRNELLTMRLFKRNISNYDTDGTENNKCFSYEKTMNRFNKKILPNLFNKIIFNKGETEKLLNYQFYKSAYKACCEPAKQDGINNLPIKTNYKNNWKLVRQYVQKKKDINKNKTEKNTTESLLSYYNTSGFNSSFFTEKIN